MDTIRGINRESVRIAWRLRLAIREGGIVMFRVLFFRFSRRRAVSTIIGGLIILSLILTALVTMVFVSQQYDQYQQSVNQDGSIR